MALILRNSRRFVGRTPVPRLGVKVRPDRGDKERHRRRGSPPRRQLGYWRDGLSHQLWKPPGEKTGTASRIPLRGSFRQCRFSSIGVASAKVDSFRTPDHPFPIWPSIGKTLLYWAKRRKMQISVGTACTSSAVQLWTTVMTAAEACGDSAIGKRWPSGETS